MLIRNPKNVSPLSVHDLNFILVLLDRSETRLTEIGINTWPKEKTGPGHVHLEKEQVFLVLSGAGRIAVGEESWSVAPHDLVYVPAGWKHQTTAQGSQDLTYLLYNGFLDATKEGHASFADHIAKVKDTRKAQAQGKETAVSRPAGDKRAVFRAWREINEAQTLLPGSATQRSEVKTHVVRDGVPLVLKAQAQTELVLFVLQGDGLIATEQAAEHRLERHDLVYLPPGMAGTVQASTGPLLCVSFTTRL